MLPGVTVFERFPVVGKLEFLAALDCRRAMLALAQFGKIAQVAFAVGAGTMSRQFLRKLHFERFVKIAATVFRNVAFAFLHVVISHFFAATGPDGW